MLVAENWLGLLDSNMGTIYALVNGHINTEAAVMVSSPLVEFL